jgi:hypothetical protein
MRVAFRSRVIAPLLVLLSVASAPPSFAGAASDALARLFEGIPAEKVASGILYDRVLALSDIGAYDGSVASPPATLAEWRQVYHELSRASLGAPAWPALDVVMDRGRARLRDDAALPIALMNIRYDRVRSDALETGALVRAGDRFALGAGEAFETHRAFAAAALTERTYRGEHVRFRLHRDDYFSNAGAPPTAIEIDFDDGRGFVPAAFDETLQVAYASVGRKTISLRATFADGASRFASFPFEVASLGTPLPSDTLAITASIPYLGQTASGEAYIYLAAGHTALTNPLIVVEGFDLYDTMNWDELYALLNRENLLEDLRAVGFDAVVLNFADATDYLQRNSFVVLELIQQVQAAIDPVGTVALAGPSMGGVVGRYALAYMENAALPHRVRTFVSFDSPQAGANIPLGIQYFVAFFADDAAEAATLLAILDSPAARQMLVYHHTEPPGATGQADPLRAGFLADLAAIGGYPDAPRLVSVANGSGAGATQGFAAGEQVVRWEYDSFIVDIRGNVWAVPNQSSQLIFYGLVDRIIGDDKEQFVTVSGTQPFDNAPGGSRASMAELDAVAAPFGDIIALHPSHCFIPTISALDLATTDLFYDIDGDPNILAQTPFDAVYFPSENQEHVLITPQNAAWLKAELGAGVTAVEGPLADGVDAIGPLSVSPNPFRESARVRFAIPEAGHAELVVYDASGRRVATLVNAPLTSGAHEAVWSGAGADGHRIGAGLYFVALRAPGVSQSHKILLR